LNVVLGCAENGILPEIDGGESACLIRDYCSFVNVGDVEWDIACYVVNVGEVLSFVNTWYYDVPFKLVSREKRVICDDKHWRPLPLVGFYPVTGGLSKV
jgi:hypothetical protein